MLNYSSLTLQPYSTEQFGPVGSSSDHGSAVISFSFSAVSQSVRIPVLIGSGVTHDNLERYVDANGMIIGSHFKEGGHWANAVAPQRVKRLMEKRNSLQHL